MKTHSIKILDSFIEKWEAQAFVDGKPMGKDHITFEWIENGAFLRQTAKTISTEGVPAEWIDARGVFRVYQMSFDGHEWKIWREAPGFSQRFTGIFSDDGKKIKGVWEASEDGESWSKDFDLEYKRIEKE